jgi:hypothetical protein
MTSLFLLSADLIYALYSFAGTGGPVATFGAVPCLTPCRVTLEIVWQGVALSQHLSERCGKCLSGKWHVRYRPYVVAIRDRIVHVHVVYHNMDDGIAFRVFLYTENGDGRAIILMPVIIGPYLADLVFGISDYWRDSSGRLGHWRGTAGHSYES